MVHRPQEPPVDSPSGGPLDYQVRSPVVAYIALLTTSTLAGALMGIAIAHRATGFLGALLGLLIVVTVIPASLAVALVKWRSR
jgi:hypothetical protein